MPYLNETGLSYYDPKLKEWIGDQPVKTIPSTLYPWTLTDKAGAVTCWPVGGTPFKPTVDFLFTEVPPASGDKGPENPSTISGVSEVKVTRCGKNLLHYPYYANSLSANGLTITANQDGTVSIKGTCTYGTFFSVCDCPPEDAYASEYIRLFDDKSYTMSLGVVSGSLSGGNVDIQCMKAGSGLGVNNVLAGSSAVINKSSGNYASYMKYRLRIASGTVCTDLVVAPQVEEGTTATAFEPYEGADYTLPLGSTYYGGSIDLATGVMTVTWVGESVEVFYNTSLVGTNTVGFRFDCSYAHGAMSVTTDELICNKFVSEVGDGDNEHCRFVGSAGANNMFIRFYISKSRLDVSSAINPASPTDSEWRAAANAWLSSNPVFISYKINNPFTVQLTPAQILSLAQTDKYVPRLNTVYTDASAVQVGYVKSPIREEYELQQAIVAQGGEI